MGLSSVQYLKSLHPDWKITYAVPKWVVPLYSKVQTSADEIIPIEEGLNYFSSLLMVHPDAIHEMHQTGSTGKANAAYALLKSIPYTFHNHHFKGESPIKDQGKPVAAIQRDLNGLHAFWGNEKEPHYLDYAPVIKTGVETKRNRVLIGAVATRETKMWPLEYVRILAQSLMARGIEVAIPVAASDKKIKHALQGLPLVEVPLSKLPKFFAESALYIGNDTGIKHLAVSVGIPTLTFFGPENPDEWHPYDNNQHPYFFTPALECRTRTAHYCGLATCDSMICLNRFSPEMVEQKVLEMLSL